MHAADTVARPLAKEEPRSPRDREYLSACQAHGVEPDLAHIREFPQVVTLPTVDRGRRVGDPCRRKFDEPACTADVILDAIDFVEREVGAQGERSLISSRTILFMVKVRNGGQMLHRAAALLLEAGLSLRDVRALWPCQIKDSPLRKARNDLKLLRKGVAA